TTQGASPLPLPLELAGSTVLAADSGGIERPATIFFISASQINSLIPAETAEGLATVTITSGDGGAFTHVVEIEPIAPGLFTANADGHGVAAAVALRVKTDGSTGYEPVAQYDGGQGRDAAAPVELGGEGDQVYLLLFGAGVGFAAGSGSLDAVKATIGGVDARVTYAGAQGGYAGLSQINLLLPRALAGRSEMDLNLTVNGHAANVVRVHVR